MTDFFRLAYNNRTRGQVKRFVFQSNLCVGCFACESACKGKHRLPSGVRWIRVEKVDGSSAEGKARLSFRLTVCQQCEEPLCISSCPTGAIYQRNDGLTLIEGEKCSGCRECLKACPWEAIAFGETSQTASKCNLCPDLTEPRCLTYCPTGALTIISFHGARRDLPGG
jgi:anaerobic dimethyl sulfoxide reductase subunit B